MPAIPLLEFSTNLVMSCYKLERVYFSLFAVGDLTSTWKPYRTHGWDDGWISEWIAAWVAEWVTEWISAPQGESEAFGKLLSRKLAHGLLNPFQFPHLSLLLSCPTFQLLLKT